MNLSLVVPVYNESGNLEPLIEEIDQALGGVLDYEIIFVDDGSTDATPGELVALRDRVARLRFIRHASNRGQSVAILSGVLAARALWIATLDGDGQNDPGDIPRLMALRDVVGAGTHPPELIAGVRRTRHDDLVRCYASRIANFVRSHLLRDQCPDTGCGLKVFRRESFLSLPHFDHMHRFLPALFRSAGHAVEFVEVNHRPRVRGCSKYGVFDRLWVGIIDMAGVIWLQHRVCRPDPRECGVERN